MATATPSPALSSVATVGEVVRTARKAQRLTQVQLAARAEVSRLFVIELEAGHPRAELGKVLLVLNALRIDPFAEYEPVKTKPAGPSEIQKEDTVMTTAQVEKHSKSIPYTPSFVVSETLASLRGPASGQVTLPNRLLWNPSRPFDLSDDNRLRSMLRIVLREATCQKDLDDYVDRDSLLRLWPNLGLPEIVRDAWERRFPELIEVDSLD